MKCNAYPTTTIYLFNYSTMKLCSLTVHNWNGFMVKAKNVGLPYSSWKLTQTVKG